MHFLIRHWKSKKPVESNHSYWKVLPWYIAHQMEKGFQKKMNFEDRGMYLLEVLWGQRIKLAQVASTSELLENQWTKLFFYSKSFPHISAGPQKKKRSFRWFSCNSEVEATWTSLIGWPHKTSSIYVLCTILHPT